MTSNPLSAVPSAKIAISRPFKTDSAIIRCTYTVNTLAVILARAGSKGLPNKCILPLAGHPVIAYTIGHAQQSKLVDAIILTTDSQPAAAIGKSAGCWIVDRPAELATDQARVDAAVRHAVLQFEDHFGQQADVVVILYGNVPVRAEGIIDRCVDHLARSGADSVRTVAPVTKTHPDWLHRLDGDRMLQYRANSIHRRQELEPLFYHDGAVIAVTRASLMAAADSDDPHAFFGTDRRAVQQREEDTVDIDTQVDFYRAEAILRVQSEAGLCEPPTAGSRRPRITAAVPYLDR